MEERMWQGFTNQAQIYVAIEIEKTEKDSLSILVPYDAKKNYKDNESDISSALRDTFIKKALEDSIKLANIMLKNINEKNSRYFTKTEPNQSFLFEDVKIPTIKIKFGVSNFNSSLISILDSKKKDSILNLINDSIVEYIFSYSEQQPLTLP